MWNTATQGHKTLITDLDEVKQRLRMEWAKLDHLIIAAGIRQYRRRESVFVHFLLQYLPHAVI